MCPSGRMECWGVCPRVIYLGLEVDWVPIFCGPAILISLVAVQAYIATSNEGVPLALHPHQHDLSLWFFATVIFLYIYLIIYFPPPLSFFPASLSHCRSSSQIVLPFSFKVTCIPQPSYFPVLDSCCLSWPLSIFMFYIYIICICNIQVWLILFDSTSPSSFHFPARFHSSSWHGKIPSCLLLVDIQADPIAWQFCLMQQ